MVSLSLSFKIHSFNIKFNYLTILIWRSFK